MLLEFGNAQHIQLAREGALYGHLLEKDPTLAQEVELIEHECNCEYCDIPENEYSCPECGRGELFHTIKDRYWSNEKQAYIEGKRYFCKNTDCEQELLIQ